MSSAVPTLFEIVLGTLDELGQVVYGMATDGATTTLIDSGLTGKKDDIYKGGTAFLTYDAGAASAAPEGEFAEVTAYADSTGTLTTVWTVAPVAGDFYALAMPDWSLDEMIGLVNRALVRMGPVPQEDTSLTTAASTTEYTLPAATRGGLRRVYMDLYASGTDSRPQELTDWVKPTGSVLRFRTQPASGNTLLLVYMAPHAALDLFDDTLSPYVPLRRIIAETTFLALRTRARQGGDRDIKQAFNDAADDLEVARKMFPIYDPGTPFKPILKGKRRGDRRRKYGQYYT